MVLLQVHLQVVSRPGVLFSDCNATRSDAVCSNNPKIVHFDVVKAKSQFDVDPELKRFYQAEVLVLSPIPPHLIVFPEPRSEPEEKGASEIVDQLPVPEHTEVKTENSLSPVRPFPADLWLSLMADFLKEQAHVISRLSALVCRDRASSLVEAPRAPIAASDGEHRPVTLPRSPKPPEKKETKELLVAAAPVGGALPVRADGFCLYYTAAVCLARRNHLCL